MEPSLIESSSQQGYGSAGWRIRASFFCEAGRKFLKVELYLKEKTSKIILIYNLIYQYITFTI